MKKVLPLLLFAFVVCNTVAQTTVETFESFKLDENRKIKIHVPEGYDEEDKTPHPLIVVLDADYLFDVVVSNAKFYSYWEKMPKAIVVGISQERSRYDDCNFSDESGLPDDKGNEFFEFIGMELVPYIADQYRVANFKMIVGHSFTANFANYYLFKDNPLFDAYIVLSPEFAPYMEERIAERLSGFQTMKFYYLATAELDDKEIAKRTKDLNTMLASIENENLNYFFDDFKTADHVSVSSYAIPKAFDQLFNVYELITPKEYKEKILTMEGPVHTYLTEKYNTIETLFGFKKPVSLNDIMAIYAAAKKKEDLESLQVLSDIGKREYPETMMNFFLLAEYHELSGEPKKALKTYEKAFTMPEVDFMTKDLVLERIDALKADFGW